MNKQKWNKIKYDESGFIPNKMSSVSMNYYRNKLYIDGGVTNEFNALDNLLEYDISTNKWNIIQLKGDNKRLAEHKSVLYNHYSILYDRGNWVYIIDLNEFTIKKIEMFNKCSPYSEVTMTILNDTVAIQGTRTSNDGVYLLNAKNAITNGWSVWRVIHQLTKGSGHELIAYKSILCSIFGYGSMFKNHNYITIYTSNNIINGELKSLSGMGVYQINEIKPRNGIRACFVNSNNNKYIFCFGGCDGNDYDSVFNDTYLISIDVINREYIKDRLIVQYFCRKYAMIGSIFIVPNIIVNTIHAYID